MAGVVANPGSGPTDEHQREADDQQDDADGRDERGREHDAQEEIDEPDESHDWAYPVKRESIVHLYAQRFDSSRAGGGYLRALAIGDVGRLHPGALQGWAGRIGGAGVRL